MALGATLGVPLQVLASQAFASSPVGVTSVPVALPLGADTFAFAVNRLVLPDTASSVFKCRAELSLDGGLTWSPNPAGEKSWPYGVFPMEFAARGSALTDPNGSAVTQSRAIINLPAAANPSRQIRIVLTPLQNVTVSVDVLCTQVASSS